MPSLNCKTLSIYEAIEIQSTVHQDHRGQFYRSFCEKEINPFLTEPFVIQQSNISITKHKGTVRGLHFQYPPYAEAKLVRCLQGEVFDVILDLRRHSPSFKKWCAVVLNAEKANMVYIPKGCAHGFQTMNDNCILLYDMNAPHSEIHATGIRIDDPMFAIQWPDHIHQLSERDKNFEPVQENYAGLTL